jgi:signal transduction histidine kinase
LTIVGPLPYFRGFSGEAFVAKRSQSRRGGARSVLHHPPRSGQHRLGLHIVYSIVTNYLGARLHLESAPGKGTKIQLILPRVAPVASAAQ